MSAKISFCLCALFALDCGGHYVGHPPGQSPPLGPDPGSQTLPPVTLLENFGDRSDQVPKVSCSPAACIAFGLRECQLGYCSVRASSSASAQSQWAPGRASGGHLDWVVRPGTFTEPASGVLRVRSHGQSADVGNIWMDPAGGAGSFPADPRWLDLVGQTFDVVLDAEMTATALQPWPAGLVTVVVTPSLTP